MSLKYTYRKITSLLLVTVIAWNSFGYVGVMIGSLVVLEMHHDQEQCEKAFCYCEVSDGLKICVCHHQNEPDTPDEDHKGFADCYLDMYHPNDFTHSASLINWDSRTFILSDVVSISILQEFNLSPFSPAFELSQGVIRIIEHPPAVV